MADKFTVDFMVDFMVDAQATSTVVGALRADAPDRGANA
jgi:hypothetical protein